MPDTPDEAHDDQRRNVAADRYVLGHSRAGVYRAVDIHWPAEQILNDEKRYDPPIEDLCRRALLRCFVVRLEKLLLLPAWGSSKKDLPLN